MTPGDRSPSRRGFAARGAGGRTHAGRVLKAATSANRLSKKFAEKAPLKFQIYPNSSLTKTIAQVDALGRARLVSASIQPPTRAGKLLN
jgi:hypothetical protein